MTRMRSQVRILYRPVYRFWQIEQHGVLVVHIRILPAKATDLLAALSRVDAMDALVGPAQQR